MQKVILILLLVLLLTACSSEIKRDPGALCLQSGGTWKEDTKSCSCSLGMTFTDSQGCTRTTS